MTDTLNKEYLKDLLKNVAQECKLKNWSFEKQSFVNVGNNFFGVIVPVIIRGYCDEKEVSLNLVLKLAPTDERFRVSGALTLFFAREIFVYTKILPKYMEIQNQWCLPEFVVPTCYYINNVYCNEAIVMQNLCANGYHPYTSNIFLDIEHLLLSLKCLANFHALSFILKNQENDLYKVAEDTCIPLNGVTNCRFMDILKDRLNKGISKFGNTEYTSMFELFLKKCDQYVEAMHKSVNNTCLCHGDIWKENLLFQYKDSQPTSVCIIDYQTTRLSSPAFDVLYLIITSSNSQLRSEHYDQLLATYYETFAHILQKSNVSVDKVYSRDMFGEDLKTVAPACLIIANTAIWLSSGLQQEGHVRSKIILETEQQYESAAEQYKGRIKDIIDLFKSYGYL